MNEKLMRFLKEEEGTETVEWAIMIGLIAVTAIGIIVGIGIWVNSKFDTLYQSIKTH